MRVVTYRRRRRRVGGVAMGKCEICRRAKAVVTAVDCVGASVCVCAGCRRRYLPTREERTRDDVIAERAAERQAERECELYAENELCGFSY